MRFRLMHLPVFFNKIIPSEPIVGGTPTISINDITVAENAGTAAFTVTRSGDTSGACSVDWATSEDSYPTARAGIDFTASSGTVSFGIGETTKTVTINVANTSNYEIDEWFWVNLSNPVGCTITDNRGICTLTDVSGFPTATVSSPTVTEGSDLVFTVTFPRLAEFTVNHPFSLTGTAVDAVHFDSTPLLSVGSIVFGDITVPPNTASLTLTFTTLNTGSVDGSKTVILTVDGNVGTGTISDTTAAAGPLDTATNSFVTADAGSGVMNITDGIGAATPTFTRSTTAATRLASGLWKLDVAVNAARSYYNESLAFDGFLCEPAATQLLAVGSTRDLTNAVWATNTTMTVAKDQTGIDGTANAASSLTATGADSILGQTVTAAASSRTFSAFVKRITGTGVVTLQQVGGTTTALDITSLINSTTWTQVELNATQLNAICNFKLATSGDAIAVDCAQFESGGKATTPIPSGGTRSADLLATGLPFNTGSYLATWKPFNGAVNAGILLGSSLSSGSTVFMRATSTTTMQCHDGTATKVPVTVSARINKTQYSTALRASGSTISGAEGGVLGAGDTFDGSFNGYTMAIGNRTGASSAPFHGTIKDVYVWNTVDLTDLELQEVTGTPPLPTITSVTATNQDEGTTATFTVTLSGAYGSAVAYTYALSGTAVAGTNFTNSPTVSGSSSIGGGNLTVAAGESVVTISYPTIHDFVASAALTLIATVAGTAATSTIFDIDTSGDSGSTIALTALTGLVT